MRAAKGGAAARNLQSGARGLFRRDADGRHQPLRIVFLESSLWAHKAMAILDLATEVADRQRRSETAEDSHQGAHAYATEIHGVLRGRRCSLPTNEQRNWGAVGGVVFRLTGC